MRIVTIVAAIFLLHGGAWAQNSPSGLERIQAFSQILAENGPKAPQTIEAATSLLDLDYTAAGFSQREERVMLSELTLLLADVGKTDLVFKAYERIFASLQRDIDSAANAKNEKAISDFRGEYIEHLRTVAAMALEAGHPQRAMSYLNQAWNLTELTIGTDDPAARFVLAEKIAAEEAAGRSIDKNQKTLLTELNERAKNPSLVNLGADNGVKPPETAQFETLRLFYAATRADDGAIDPHRAYRGGRGKLDLGSVIVTIPKKRVAGSIPRPFALDRRGARDGVHIVLKQVERDASPSAWAERLSDSLNFDPDGKREAFIFIHGHATGFDSAALRTAQLAADLDMRRGAIFYAWPSGNSVLAYQTSQNNAPWAVEGLVELIKSSAPEADRLHLIAHSIGNRVLLQALEQLEREGFKQEKSEGKAIAEVIWGSPDEDAEVFSDRAARLAHLANGMTLYASKNDRALQLSQRIGGDYPRAGQAPPLFPVARAISSVDTSSLGGIDLDFLSHSDYATEAINDLRAVIWFGLPTDARCPLIRRELRRGVAYWQATNNRQGCREREFRRAIQARRLYGDSASQEIQDFIRTLDVENNKADAESWREALKILEQIQ